MSVLVASAAGAQVVSDTSPLWQLQVGSSLIALTLNAVGAIGIGPTPNYGTAGQVLVSAGSGAIAAWGSVAAIGAAASGANADITSLSGITTPLTVTQGGTGSNTIALNGVVVGNGTSAVQTVAPSTTGNVLTSNGTTWSSQPVGTISALPIAMQFTGGNNAPGSFSQSDGFALI